MGHNKPKLQSNNFKIISSEFIKDKMPPKRAKKTSAKESTTKKRKIETENKAENFKENVDSSDSDRKSGVSEQLSPSSKKPKCDSADLTGKILIDFLLTVYLKKIS